MSSGTMESFCPLCAKNGTKRRVKAFQINLEEAMWACEGEDCTWPIGYEELVFFNRPAISCNWEESSSTREDTPALIELSLYTPPVTPGGELSKELSEIVSSEYSLNPSAEDKVGILSHCESSKGSTSSTKSLCELMEVGGVNSTEENKSIINELIEGVRALPKITNIEKTKINIQICSNVNEHCDKRETWEHSLMDVSITDSFKNLDSSGNACADFGLSMQHETGGEQNESGRLQSSTPVNGAETNFGAATSESVTLDVNDIMNTSSLTNVSIANMSDSYMDKLIGDFLNDESQVPAVNEAEWLNDLFS